MGFRTKLRNKITVKNLLVRQFLAEFLGTFILAVFCRACVAQTVLSHGVYGTALSMNLAAGIAVMMGIWMGGGVSGGHINPAITLSLVVLGRLPARKLPCFWLAQYFGAFIGASCVYLVYYDALNNFDGGYRQMFGAKGTAGIWATYPQEYLSIFGGFVDQVFGTMLLLICVMAIYDHHNMGPDKGLTPLCVGFLMALIGMSYGLNCGYAINPAADFGPRAFSALAGWGTEVFTAYNYFFWVPLVSPHIGAICGVLIYQTLVGVHTPGSTKEESQKLSLTTDLQVNKSEQPVEHNDSTKRSNIYTLDPTDEKL